MAKVAAVEKDDIKPFDDDEGDLKKLTKVLKRLVEKFDEEESKHKPRVTEERITGEEDLFTRLKRNNLAEMFIGKEVLVEDVDNVVNTLTLMNALILTIPYGIMGSASHEYWDWVEETLAGCESTKYTFEQDFTLFLNSCNAVVFSSMSSLLMAVVYYLLRPKDTEKFRKWWKKARYTIILILIGTTAAVVSLVSVSLWLIAWFNVPTSKYCFYTSQQATFIGIGFVVFSFLVAFVSML